MVNAQPSINTIRLGASPLGKQGGGQTGAMERGKAIS